MIRPLKIYTELSQVVCTLRFALPISHVYNPLEYACVPHRKYFQSYGIGKREVIFLGMNPGPWGMAQTGVPFGEINAVRDWMNIEGLVREPQRQHAKRPVVGFKCERSEVSGARLWGWAQARFKRPTAFFKHCIVLNYCPLVFMEESGRNRTPDKLPVGERKPLEGACDRALIQLVEYYQPKFVVGVGAFAEKQALRALKWHDVHIGKILHPSPASPAANRGWAQAVENQLSDLGIAFR